MTNSELLLKRGEQLRMAAKILFKILIGSVGLFLIGGFLHGASTTWSMGMDWSRYVAGRPHWDFKIAKEIRIISFIGAGIGFWSIPCYVQALNWLGLGQVAKNTDKQDSTSSEPSVVTVKASTTCNTRNSTYERPPVAAPAEGTWTCKHCGTINRANHGQCKKCAKYR